MKATRKPVVKKRPVKRIPNFEIVVEDQKNVVNRLRKALETNPNMSVMEFLHKSKFKPVANKQIVELVRKHFGDLSIKELKTKQINYFIGMYTTEPKVREEVIKRINLDPQRQEYRVVRQRIDFVNKIKENKNYKKKVTSAIKVLQNTNVGKIFGDFKLRSLNQKEPAFRFLQKYCPDLTFNQIKELIKNNL
jgi:hypothetical protein